MRRQRHGGGGCLYRRRRGHMRFGPLGCHLVGDSVRYVQFALQLSRNPCIHQHFEDFDNASGAHLRQRRTMLPISFSPFSGNVRSRPRRFKGQSGAALVEYAFTFIFSMTLFLGIMGFGQALYAYHFVNNSAKEATRWASVNGANCNYDSSCNGTAPMNNGPAKSADVNTFVQNHIPP